MLHLRDHYKIVFYHQHFALAKKLSHIFPEHDAGDAIDEWVDERVEDELSPGACRKHVDPR